MAAPVRARAGVIGGLQRELLRRVTSADRHDRFQLRDVCPRDATRFVLTLESLLDDEWAERVPVAVGKWFYRLTAAGRTAAEAFAGRSATV